MQMSLAESVHTYLIPSLADTLTGFGLTVLLEFSRTSPEMNHFFPICIGALLVGGGLVLFRPPHPPAWVSLCNATFSLVVTLSLVLNLLAQLCPPSGKELSLIPAYVLLCTPRMSPSGRALMVQCGLTLLLLCFFLVLPTSRHTRPDGDVGVGLSLAVSVGTGSLLQTFGSGEYFDYYGAKLYREQSRWWAVLAVIGKGLLLVLMGSVRNTSLYHFMFDRPNAVPMELFAGYGVLLLFSCMQAASVWFGLLKEILGRQAKWRLVVRIQHIIYALIVAAAWAFPLQLHGLRVVVLVVLAALNVLHSFFVINEC
jgi:hypothetical protein